MSDEKLPLIVHPGSGLVHAGPQGGRIVAEMVSGALTLSRAVEETNVALVPRFNIGEHVFCEPDYRQILLWANALELDAEEVIVRLLDQSSTLRSSGSIPFYHTRNETVFLNGRIVKLNWNLDLLPIRDFEWVEGLEIEWLWLRFSGSKLKGTQKNRQERPCLSISPQLPKLRSLDCNNVRIESLDLSHTRRLNVLILVDHGLQILDIPHLPQLETLWCSDTDIVQLNVSKVPALINMWIWESKLSELDLTNLPKLKSFQMMFGGLTVLEISHLVRLEEFLCANNRLETLVFANHPKLVRLQCLNNSLHTLLIQGTPQLKTLWCENNKLARIDLSGASKLEELHSDENQIELLDIRPLKCLKELRYDKNVTSLIQRPDQNF